MYLSDCWGKQILIKRESTHFYDANIKSVVEVKHQLYMHYGISLYYLTPKDLTHSLKLVFLLSLHSVEPRYKKYFCNPFPEHFEAPWYSPLIFDRYCLRILKRQ
uniref:Uncharacterized protein n=1 Tax=Lepeophtheirus salmonis TaxID=72036 RepID=A0A0K2T3L1_LEPSM